jgi:hypothetical protein
MKVTTSRGFLLSRHDQRSVQVTDYSIVAESIRVDRLAVGDLGNRKNSPTRDAGLLVDGLSVNRRAAPALDDPCLEAVTAHGDHGLQ